MVSSMRKVPAARKMSGLPTEAAFTRTRMSSSPAIVGMGRMRCSNFAGSAKADTPTARIVGSAMGVGGDHFWLGERYYMRMRPPSRRFVDTPKDSKECCHSLMGGNVRPTPSFKMSDVVKL